MSKPQAEQQSHSFYISSPYLGLIKERERVKELINRAGHAYRDSYSGSSEPVVNTCQNDVRSADHYILLLSYRYGSIAKDGSGLSITELEYEAALEAGKQIRAFFLEFTSDLKNAFERDPQAQESLERFKARVSDHCTPMLCGDEPGGGASGPELFEQAIVRLAANPPTRSSQPQGQPIKFQYGLAEVEAWVEAHHQAVARYFAQLITVSERRIHVPLMLRLQAPGQQAKLLELEPEHLNHTIEDSEAELIVISADGGAGKTSLAVRIAHWALEGVLGGKRRLPVLIDRALETNESLGQRVQHQLEQSIGSGQLDQELVEAMLRHKRLLPIVDHFSEMPEAARQQLRDTLPAGLSIITTRRSDTDGFVERPVTLITPLQISTDRLQSFFLEYLTEQGLNDRLNDNELGPAQNQLRRIVGDKPISVMLAQMFIFDVISKRELGRGLLADSVPELMLSYVSRLDHGSTPQQRRRAGLEITSALVQRALQVIALASLRQGIAGRPLYQAIAIRQQRAEQALAAPPPEGLGLDNRRQRQALLDYLVDRHLLQHPGADLDEFAFPLEALADYLAALRQRDLLESDQPWQPLIEDLEGRSHAEREGMRGFLLALRDACHDRLKRTDSPALIPRELPDRLGRLADLDPEEERTRLEEQRAHKWLWELSVPVASERHDAIRKLAAMAGPAAPPSSRRAVQRLVTERLTQLLHNPELPVAERQDAATVLGLLGTRPASEALLDVIGAEAGEPGLRQAAAEALGLIDLPADGGGAAIDSALLALLHSNHLNKETKAERLDAALPLLQGVARAIQLRMAQQLPLLGSGAGLAVPMLTLTCSKGAISTKVVTVAVWRLPLPQGLQLELVEIPAGSHQLGSDANEAGRDDYSIFPECKGVDVEAQRTVDLGTFSIGRFPITQAQWAAVAHLEAEAGSPELNPNPSASQTYGIWSRFVEAGSQPVDSVSWLDCQEWLRRLNGWLAQQLGASAPQLSLPSESYWEAACRAGSTTPFNMGDSLDPIAANFDGTYSYGDGRLGPFRQTTTVVGQLGVVNAWGLGEMHAHLWEWCLDRWHASPLGGPPDGRGWEEPDPNLDGNPRQDDRLARGGTWCSHPLTCRSAIRGAIPPIDRDLLVGFRVACLPSSAPAIAPDAPKTPTKRSSSRASRARSKAA
jgi:formylglycine-generating enzyme required for sulfatase activity